MGHPPSALGHGARVIAALIALAVIVATCVGIGVYYAARADNMARVPSVAWATAFAILFWLAIAGAFVFSASLVVYCIIASTVDQLSGARAARERAGR